MVELSEAAKIIRKTILLDMPRGKRGRLMEERSFEVAELALDTGLHPNTIRTAVRQYGDVMFKRARVEYNPGVTIHSGRGAFGRQPGSPGGYMTATVDVVLRSENPERRTPQETAEVLVERYGRQKAADVAADYRAAADFDWQDSGPKGQRDDAILQRWDYWDEVLSHIHGRPTGAVRPDRSTKQLKNRLMR